MQQQGSAKPDTDTGAFLLPEMMDDDVPANEESTAELEEELTQEESLQRSYETAIAVQTMMISLLPDLDPEIGKELLTPLQEFDADIEDLRFYTELAARGPLTDADQHTILQLVADIEDAMNFFANVIELFQ